MNNRWAARWCAAGAVLAAVGGTQAATMTLTDWRHDRGNTVEVTRSGVKANVWAGGFEGTLTGAPFALDTSTLEAYCVELTQTFSFGSTYGVSVQPADVYLGDTAKVDQLGRLFSHVFDQNLFGTASDRDELSSVLQLAVWNVVYDDDLNLGSGSFNAKGQLGGLATALLNNSKHADITHDLFVLASPTAQDQLTWRARPQIVLAESEHAVPEPGSGWLAAAALSLLALRWRRG